jgi:hypothetical protein
MQESHPKDGGGGGVRDSRERKDTAVQISYGSGHERCIRKRTSTLAPQKPKSRVCLRLHKKIILGLHTKCLCGTNNKYL